jgi:hypothetical protein
MKTSKPPGIRVEATALALCLLFLVAQQAPAQSTRIDGGMVSQEKFGFYWETRLVPPAPPMSDFSTATAYGPGVIHRVLQDRKKRVYVGYDAVVTVLPGPNSYHVTFQKLTMTPELAQNFFGDNPSSWTEIRTPGWGPPAPPTPQDIHGGEVLQLDLLTNARTGQRVTDYVTVQEPSQKFVGFNAQYIPDRKFAFAPGPSRDFKADDVELTIQAPRLTVNGKLDESTTKRFDEVSGSVVWLYISKHGRYLLSLIPHPELGFRKAGEVRGSSLSFTMGSETFTVNAGARIAPGEAPFNLYVLHDPNWKPTYPNADLDVFNMGALDRAESIVTR